MKFDEKEQANLAEATKKIFQVCVEHNLSLLEVCGVFGFVVSTIMSSHPKFENNPVIFKKLVKKLFSQTEKTTIKTLGNWYRIDNASLDA